MGRPPAARHASSPRLRSAACPRLPSAAGSAARRAAGGLAWKVIGRTTAPRRLRLGAVRARAGANGACVYFGVARAVCVCLCAQG